MEEILKEWKESDICKRINALESFCQLHGFEEYKGQNIPGWLKEKLTVFEKKIKIDFLKRILPEMKMQDKDMETRDEIEVALKSGYNNCIEEITFNANKEGINIWKK